MRFLLTVHQFFPEYGAGTEVLTLGVAQELQRRGHEVCVFAAHPGHSTALTGYDVEGVPVVRLPTDGAAPTDGPSRTEIAYRNPHAAAHFAQIVNTFAPDVVHFFHLSRLGGALVDVAVDAKVPTYYTPTDFWAVCQTAQLLLPGGRICSGPTPHAGNCVKHAAALTQGGIVGEAARLLPDAVMDVVTRCTAAGKLPAYPHHRDVAAMHQRLAFLVRRLNWLHGIVAPTSVVADTLTRHGVAPDLIVRAGYGIDTAGIDANVSEQREGEPLRVGFIGTLAPHKGCHVLIDAFKYLAPGQARLRIHGNPDDFPAYYEKLRRQAVGREDIVFCGTFPRHDLGRVMADLHVLAVPSLWAENAPLVVHSALTAKRPVIVSDFPGLTELVADGFNGLTFPAGDARALHGCLQRLLQDRSLVAKLGVNCHGPKTVATYVDELLALYTRGPLIDMQKRDYHGLLDISPAPDLADVIPRRLHAQRRPSER